MFMIKLSRSAKLGLILGAGLVVAALAWFFTSRSGEAGPKSDGAKSAKAALSVTVTQAVQSDWPMTLSANGNITAWQEAIIGTEAGGLRLEEVLVNIGDKVRKGQLLARLQSATISAELEQARASLEEAEARGQKRRLTPTGRASCSRPGR